MVELGEFDISGATEFMPTRQAKVKRVVVHKDYQAPTFENDIAILELVKTQIIYDIKISVKLIWNHLVYRIVFLGIVAHSLTANWNDIRTWGYSSTTQSKKSKLKL